MKKRILLFICLIISLSQTGNGLSIGSDDPVDSLNVLLIHQPKDTGRVIILCEMARQVVNKNTQLALTYAREALTLSDSLRAKPMQARSNLVTGNIYLACGDYRSALFYYLQSLRIQEALQNKKITASLYNNIGIIYFHLKHYSLADKYYSLSLALMTKLAMKKDIGPLYNNLGNLERVRGKIPQAMARYRQAHHAAKNFSIREYQYSPLINLGELFMENGDLDSAGICFSESLRESIRANRQVFIASALEHRARVDVQRGRIAEAEKALLKARVLAEGANARELRPSIYLALARLYEKKKDYRSAYDLQIQYHNLRDSMFNIDVASQLNDMQAGYDIERKNRQIEILSKDRVIAEARSKRETLLRNSLVGGLALVVIACFILLRNIRLKHRMNNLLNGKNLELSDKNKQIQKQAMEIERQNKELDSFNKELIRENIFAQYEVLKSKVNPHFLFNTLTSLSALIIRNQQAAIEFIGRFSRLYRMILDTSGRNVITFKAEMKTVEHYLYLQNIRFGSNLVVDINVSRELHTRLIPPFCIQMVVENAIQHNAILEDAKLLIHIYTEGEQIIVRNNIQEASITQESTTTGQKNIIERYRLLDSTVKPMFINRNNMEYEVRLPLLSETLPKQDAAALEPARSYQIT